MSVMQDKMRLVEIVDVDSFSGMDKDVSGPGKEDFRFPDHIGILPIRSAVAYPGTVMPLAIGREKSRQLIDDMIPHETIFGLVAQIDPDIEDPGPDDIYRVGTAASVLKVIRMPQGSLNVIAVSYTHLTLPTN